MADHGVPRTPENVGRWDKLVRIILGLALFAATLALQLPEPTGGYLRLAAMAIIAIGAFGWCPLYGILGIRTNRGEAAHV
jgi:hypothetical protein